MQTFVHNYTPCIKSCCVAISFCKRGRAAGRCYGRSKKRVAPPEGGATREMLSAVQDYFISSASILIQ